MFYTECNDKPNLEVNSMTRKVLIEQLIQHEMDSYYLNAMDFEDPLLENANVLQDRSAMDNPVNEDSLRIRQAIEAHLEKRRLQEQLYDLDEAQDDDDINNSEG